MLNKLPKAVRIRIVPRPQPHPLEELYADEEFKKEYALGMEKEWAEIRRMEKEAGNAKD